MERFAYTVLIYAVIAQMAADASANALLGYGPLGVMCGWFMWRNEKLLGEVRRLGHNFRGLETALLIEAVGRPGCSPMVKDYADKEIRRITDAKAREKAPSEL